MRQDKPPPRCLPIAYAAAPRASWSLVGCSCYMSLPSAGRPCSFLRRGRSLMTVTHAAPPASRQASPPRRWTRTSSCLRCHTRPHGPRRAPSTRRQSAPSRRRARRAPPQAYSRFPRHQPAANGRPSWARHWPTSHTLCHRCIATSLGHRTRSRALRVSARSRAGATGGQTRPHPAHNRVVSLGVRPCCRLCARLRWRAVWAGASDTRYACTAPPTAAAWVGACPRTALGRLVSHGGSRSTCQRSTRGPAPLATGRGVGRMRRMTSAWCLPVSPRGVASPSPRSARATSPGPHGKCPRLAPGC